MLFSPGVFLSRPASPRRLSMGVPISLLFASLRPIDPKWFVFVGLGFSVVFCFLFWFYCPSLPLTRFLSFERDQ